jgi:hypothetical protein
MAETIFSVIARDGAHGPRLRKDLLSAHLAFVEANLPRYRVAGPLVEADGAMISSLFLIVAVSEEDARAFMACDPYVSGGLYAELIYRVFRPAAGAWIGGKTW